MSDEKKDLKNVSEILLKFHDGYIRADKTGKIVLANEAIAAICGYSSPSEMIGLHMKQLYVNPQERELMLKQLQEQGQLLNYEIKLLKKDGSSFCSLNNITLLTDERGRTIGTEGLIRDITDIIETRNDLQEKQKELTEIAHNMGERVKELNCLYSISQIMIEENNVNEILERIVQLIPPAWHYPEITAGRIKYKNKIFQTENFIKTKWLQSAELKIFGKSEGVVEVCYLEAKPELDEGPFLQEERALLDTMVKIIGKALEKQLKEEELKTAFQQLSASEQQLKASNQQIRASEQQLQSINQQLRASNQQLEANEQQLRTSEEENRQKSEELSHQLDLSEKQRKANLIILKDLTRTKRELEAEIAVREKTEKALNTTLVKYKTLFDSIPIGITISDKIGKIIESNKIAEELLGLSEAEQKKRQISGKEWKIIRSDGSQMPAEEYASVRALKEKQLVENVQMGIIKAENKITWLNVSAVPIPLKEMGVLIAYNDITELINARELTKQSLHEREILLRELYHRTKNNMQMIISLLSLKLRYYKEDKLKQIVAEISNKIKSMALVHQKLYKSDNLSEINIRDYIMDLVKEVSVSLPSQKTILNPVFDLDDIMLDIDAAIPLGLIINELVTNCLKYAYPGKKEGEIKVDFKVSHTGYVLSVRDFGLGFPADFDLDKDKKMGLKIILLLSKQINGSTEFYNDQGLNCKIAFEPKKGNRLIYE